MDPWFYETVDLLERDASRQELLDALGRLEDNFDRFDEMEQDIAADLIGRLNAKLESL
ncbi:MAG: hypothetical protein P8124_12120 [Gammaproteobacteria bacterium]